MTFFQRIKKILYSRVVRIFGLFLVSIVILCLLLALSFDSYCGSQQADFKPVQSQSLQTNVFSIPDLSKYNRRMESTYLTFPEWYLVFNPQEYARFIASNRPSRFPYFTSIQQFWGGYCQVYGITKHNYPFNKGDHLVEVVIGTSFSVEYVAKGVWENTIGRVSEWTSGGEQTEEDVYAARVADAYGKFIPDYPWYEFPFPSSFTGLWSQTKIFGPHSVRKFERKIYLSIEYGIKALYAKIISTGTHAVYGIADTEVYAMVQHAVPSALSDPSVRIVQDLGNGGFVITLPHYQGFTDTAPSLAEKGVDFIEIAGNKEILMSFISPDNFTLKNNQVKILFSMKVLGEMKKKRVAIQVPVESLSFIIRELAAKDIPIEHIFDY